MSIRRAWKGVVALLLSAGLAGAALAAPAQAATAPILLTSWNAGTDAIHLGWSPVDGADRYKVTITPDIYGMSTKIVSIPLVSFYDVAPGSTYTVVVTATSGSVALTSGVYTVQTTPAQTVGLRSTGKTETSIALAWSATSGATYTVDALAADGSSKTVSSPSNSTTLTGLKAGTTYSIRVLAKVQTVVGYAGTSTGAWSRPLTITTSAKTATSNDGTIGSTSSNSSGSTGNKAISKKTKAKLSKVSLKRKGKTITVSATVKKAKGTKVQLKVRNKSKWRTVKTVKIRKASVKLKIRAKVAKGKPVSLTVLPNTKVIGTVISVGG